MGDADRAADKNSENAHQNLVVAEVEKLMDADVKSTGLKELQGTDLGRLDMIKESYLRTYSMMLHQHLKIGRKQASTCAFFLPEVSPRRKYFSSTPNMVLSQTTYRDITTPQRDRNVSRRVID